MISNAAAATINAAGITVVGSEVEERITTDTAANLISVTKPDPDGCDIINGCLAVAGVAKQVCVHNPLGVYAGSWKGTWKSDNPMIQLRGDVDLTIGEDGAVEGLINEPWQGKAQILAEIDANNHVTGSYEYFTDMEDGKSAPCKDGEDAGPCTAVNFVGMVAINSKKQLTGQFHTVNNWILDFASFTMDKQ